MAFAHRTFGQEASGNGPALASGSAIPFPFCLVSAVPGTMIFHLNLRPNWDLKMLYELNDESTICL
jgi:hypothetical protein